MTIAATAVSLSSLLQLRWQAQAFGLLQQRSKVLTTLTGGYMSAFRGRGMDFAETRNYQAGDDIRHMDWRVTARTGKPHTKLYCEERERPVFFVVDYSPSMFFGTRTMFKSVLAAHTAALLAWSAVKQGDRVGGLIFSGERHIELRPGGRQQGILRLLRALAEHSQQPGQNSTTALNNALVRMRRVIKPGSLVFVLSDFRNFDDNTALCLSQLAKHNEVTAGLIYDGLEKDPPPARHYTFTNGQQTVLFDATATQLCAAYREQFQQRQQAVQEACVKNQIHFLMLATHQTPINVLRQQSHKNHE